MRQETTAAAHREKGDIRALGIQIGFRGSGALHESQAHTVRIGIGYGVVAGKILIDQLREPVTVGNCGRKMVALPPGGNIEGKLRVFLQAKLGIFLRAMDEQFRHPDTNAFHGGYGGGQRNVEGQQEKGARLSYPGQRPHCKPGKSGLARRPADQPRQLRAAGAPKGAVSCLTIPALAGCQELMSAPEVRLILATGGPGMVRAAYSSGKPAIGVGAGNGPAYIHRSADVPAAIACIAASKTFDNGTVCASEQSIIVEKSMEEAVRAEAQRQGFYFMPEQEARKLARLLFRPTGGLNPDIVGKSALALSKLAGFEVPPGTRILVAREQQAGPTRPYSMEKLCPVLAFFVMDSEDAVLDKAVEVLRHEGSGHTFVIHAQDETVIRRFALKIPVSRFLVNAPAALGGIGAATNLFPALTLGCGAVGGSSSSNNVSPLDLINIRRVAWGIEEERSGAPVSEVDAALVEQLAKKILERLG